MTHCFIDPRNLRPCSTSNENSFARRISFAGWRFMILAVALVLACFDSLLELFGRFEQGPGLLTWIHGSAWYQWLDTPIVWGCLIGAILLWGRWDHVSWQRRAGLFLVMNLVDVGLWFMARGDAMGARVGEFGHEWLRMNLGIALGWGEFALISSLTCDYLVHLGVDHARDSDKSTRSMAATGAMLWLLLFCQRTNWRAGWPLQGQHAPRPGRPPAVSRLSLDLDDHADPGDGARRSRRCVRARTFSRRWTAKTKKTTCFAPGPILRIRSRVSRPIARKDAGRV